MQSLLNHGRMDSPARTAVAPSARLPVPWMWTSMAGRPAPCEVKRGEDDQRSSSRAGLTQRAALTPAGDRQPHRGVILVSDVAYMIEDLIHREWAAYSETFTGLT